MTRHLHANGGNVAMAFRNGLRDSVSELSVRLTELYSELDFADVDQHEAELVAQVIALITSFINSSLATQRGSHKAGMAREAAKLISRVEMGTKTSFKLAVFEHRKRHLRTTRTEGATDTVGQISVFWAWQSDFPTSRNQIAGVLEKVVAEANRWEPIAPIVLEQAVSLGAVAVRIDGALLDKIRTSQFFVADVTPVAAVGDNLLPNPNVLIEVGYALSSKAAPEVFLVECRSRTNDLLKENPAARFPFDIDHVHRITYVEPRKLRERLAADLRVRLSNRGLLRSVPAKKDTLQPS